MHMRHCCSFAMNLKTYTVRSVAHLICTWLVIFEIICPLAAFWRYSFEWYNGTLESIKTSWNGPEKKMLKKLWLCNHFEMIQTHLNNDFFSLLYNQTFPLWNLCLMIIHF